MAHKTSPPATTTACPACLGRNTTVLFPVSSSDAAQLLVIREGQFRDTHDHLVSVIERMWGGPECDMRRCEECGFGFASPFIAGDSEFYNLAYPTVGYPAMKWEYTRTLEAIRRSASAEMSALEVAAGHGFFLDLCTHRGMLDPSRITATEFNDDSLRLLRSKGYRARSADFREVEFDEQGAFDFIFLFQVVEHLDDIDGIFSRLRHLSAPGGRIFIAVPNTAWIAYREEHGSLRDLPPTHIGRWTPEAFSAAANRHGLAVTDFEIEPFSPIPFIRDDLIFSHFARAHRPGTLANRARAMPSRTAGRIAEAMETVVFAPRRIGAWRAGFGGRHSMGGAALWVQLEIQEYMKEA